MKVLLLANSNSAHTFRWAKSLKDSDYSISLFSLYAPDSQLDYEANAIEVYSLNLSKELQMKKADNLSKLVYLKSIRQVKQIIKKIKPDILHSHYASSYGFIGALAGFHPYIISVWGADIYNFPNYSFIHRAIINFSLSKADKILSTSNTMKAEVKKYTKKEIIVTPFGIDVKRFEPVKVNRLFKDDDLVIGTVKALEKKYGIEYLIQGFSIVKKKFPGMSLKLLIVGKGTHELYLKNLVKKLNLEEDTIFTGYVNPDEVQVYHNMLDISVAVSTDKSESFGVAVLEAGACSKPVIVSNIGGLPEVVDHGKTGIIIQPMNDVALAEALSELIINPELRTEMGRNGRKKVLTEYNWSESVNKMISVYKSVFN
jgi:L-malate glycosyltransferase